MPEAKSSDKIQDQYEVEYSDFKDRTVPQSFCRTLIHFWKLFWESAILTPFMVYSTLFNAAAYIFMGMRINPDPLEISAFGFYLSFFNLLLSKLAEFGNEKLGLELSKALGSKSYKTYREVFGKGALTIAIQFVVLALPLIFFIGDILRLIGTSPMLADLIGKSSRLSLPYFIGQLFNSTVQAFCNSQGLEGHFGLIGMISMAFAIPASYYLIYKIDLGVSGYIIVRSALELLNLIMVVMVYFQTDRRTRGFESWKDTTTGLFHYFIESIKFSVGSYAYSLTFQISSSFAVLTRDQAEIAAYFAIGNFVGIPYRFANAFSTICRTRFNIMIGMNHQQRAKNFYIFSLYCMAIYSLVLSALIFIFRNQIGYLYSISNPEMTRKLARLLGVTSILVPLFLMMAATGQGMKTSNQVNLLLWLSLLFLLGGNLAATIICFFVNNTPTMYFFGYLFSINLLSFAALIASLLFDWTKIEAVYNKQGDSTPLLNQVEGQEEYLESLEQPSTIRKMDDIEPKGKLAFEQGNETK